MTTPARPPAVPGDRVRVRLAFDPQGNLLPAGRQRSVAGVVLYNRRLRVEPVEYRVWVKLTAWAKGSKRRRLVLPNQIERCA